MITKISQKELDSIPKFIDDWREFILKDSSDEEIIAVVGETWEKLGEKKPLVFIFDSPISIVLVIMLFESQLRSQLRSQLDNQLRSQLRSQLDSQLHSQLDSQLRSQLENQLRSQLRSQLDSQLRSQLYSPLGSELDNQLRSQLDNQLRSQLRSQLGSQLHSQLDNWYVPIGWSAWNGYYEFTSRLGVKYDENNRRLFNDFCRHIICVFPFKNISFVSRKPITTWKNGRLHNEKEAAYKFRDGFSMYFLNGVKVPDWLVKTAEEDLKIEQMLEIGNAEVRREFVRKIGVDGLIKHGKSIEKGDNYELIDLGNFLVRKEYAPYLVMKNPSIGVWHCEGVARECKTIQQALNWRNQSEKKPLVLT